MTLIRKTGTVKSFRETEGWGFIYNDDGGEVYVHFTDIAGEKGQHRSLTPGERVEFSLFRRGPRGDKAVDVLKI